MSADGSTIRHVSDVDLNAYFDGSLSPSNVAETELHLASCPDCRSRVASMSGARRAVRLLPPPSVPDIVWRSVNRRFQSAHRVGVSALDGAGSSDSHYRGTTDRRSAGSRYDARRPCPSRPSRRIAGPHPSGNTAHAGASKNGVYGWKAAATIGLAVALLVILVASPLGGRIAEAVQPSAAGIDYGGYVAGLTDETTMGEFETTYDQRRLPLPVSTSLADRLVGRELLVGRSGGLILRAAHSLSDNGVRAVRMTYVGEDARIDLFRQPADHPALLDGLRPYHVTLAGVACIAADTKRHRLVTFIRDQERYVVVMRRPASGWVDSYAKEPRLDDLIADLHRSGTQ